LLRPLLASLLTAVVLAAPSRARADEAESPWFDTEKEQPPRSSKRDWYGWETLLTDSLATGVVGMGISTGRAPYAGTFAFAGLGTFALGGPIVHAAHGRWGIAAADVGLRVGSVALGAVVGGMLGKAAQGNSCGGAAGVDDICVPSDSGLIEGVFFGGMVGVVVASAIDSAVLAREPRASPPDEARLTWSPMVGPIKDGVTVGVSARF
jgi:hypothetical protein